MENGRRVDGCGRGVDDNRLSQPLEQLACDAYPGFDPLGFAQVRQGELDLPAEVPRDPVRGFCWPERAGPREEAHVEVV